MTTPPTAQMLPPDYPGIDLVACAKLAADPSTPIPRVVP